MPSMTGMPLNREKVILLQYMVGMCQIVVVLLQCNYFKNQDDSVHILWVLRTTIIHYTPTAVKEQEL